MKLRTKQYNVNEMASISGRQLFAWYDENEVLVYIPRIGEYYDDKTVSRPIWITPSFSWMMHHSDWLESADYETIECMTIQRFAFDDMLLKACPAYFPNSVFDAEDEWEKKRASAMIQYRWDADYTPDGSVANREVLMIGIHSRTWMQYVIQNQITTYNDIDDALFKQKEHTVEPYDLLIVPDATPYPIDDSIQQILDI